MKNSTPKNFMIRVGIALVFCLLFGTQVNAQNWILFDGSYEPGPSSTPVAFADGDSWSFDNVPMTTDGNILLISSPSGNTTKGNKKFSTKIDTLKFGTWMFRTRMVYTAGVPQRSQDIEMDCGVGQRAQFTLIYDGTNSWWTFNDANGASIIEYKSALDFDVENFHTYRVTTEDGITYKLFVDENPNAAAVLTSGKATSSKPRLFFKFGDNYSTASFTEGELDWIAGDTTGAYGPKDKLPAGVIVDGTPLYPMNLMASDIMATGFTLNWDASAIATGYKLELATDTAFENIVTGYEEKDLGNVLTFSPEGLSSNTTYYARIEAYNDTTIGAMSPYIMVATSPAAPVAVDASSVSESAFDANWDATEGAAGYKLDVATDADFTTMLNGFDDLDVGDVLTYSVTGLSATTDYYYRLRAYSDTWTTGNSNVIMVTTSEPALSAPPAPVASDATAVKQMEFMAHWAAASTATGYVLYVATDAAFENRVTGFDSLTVNGTSRQVTGLTSSTIYYYRVRAFNSAGLSETSNAITVTTLIDVPPAPVATDATGIDFTGFTANWNASETATGYKLDVATDDAFTAMVVGFSAKDVGNVTTFDITGLTSKVTYYFRVRAYNDGGNSPNSNTISLSTLDVSVKDRLAKQLIITQSNYSLNIKCGTTMDKIMVFDITGKLLLSRNVNNSTAELSTLGLHNGIYLVRVQSGPNDQVRKVNIIR